MSAPATPSGNRSSSGLDVSSLPGLMTRFHADVEGRHKKVTIVGAGAVGLAAAYSILNQGLCTEMSLVDVMEDKLRGELMDLQHGSAFLRRMILRASPDYAVSKDSDVVIITAGARQREGESRLDLVGRNLAIFKSIVPQIVHYSPRCVIIVVSNPVDILTYITARLSGFPVGRVFGSGTALDSSRFRTLVAEKLGIDTRSVHGMIVGEHGDSSVPVWSALNVGGVALRSLNPKLGTEGDADHWGDVHKQVVNSAYEVIKAKGYTNFAIGLAIANIVEAVLRHEHRVMPVSVPIKGRYGITEDVYLSLPAVVGIDGVSAVLALPLDAQEEEKLRKSAQAIHAVQSGLDFSGFPESATVNGVPAID